MAELEGAIIRGYRLQKSLSKSGVAETYLAYPYEREGDRVVIKIFRHSSVQKKAFRDYFLVEAARIAQFSHEHILSSLEHGQEEEWLYVIMPYMAGGNLEDLLIRVGGRLSAMQALPIVQQLSAALSYIHEQQIIHANLKPQNVLLAENGCILLSDFSLMRSYDDSQQSLTRIGWGSAEYASPEQSLGIQRRSSDIYALGVILYRILAGTAPFTGQTPIEVLLKHVRQPAPSLRTFVPTISDPVDQVLARALQKRADERYSSVEELYQAFEAAVRLAPVASPVARGITRTLFIEPTEESEQTQKHAPLRKMPWLDGDPVTPIPVSLALEGTEMPQSAETVEEPESHEAGSTLNKEPQADIPQYEFPSPTWSSSPSQWSPIAQEREAGGIALTAETYLREMPLVEDSAEEAAVQENTSEEPGAMELQEKKAKNPFAAFLRRWLPFVVVALLLIGLLGALLSAWFLQN